LPSGQGQNSFIHELKKGRKAMTTHVQTATAPGSLLRNTLLGNALFSIATGLICLLDAAPVAQWMGITSPWLLQALGLGVLLFGLEVGWIALRSTDLRRAGQVILALDVAWVAASVLLVMSGWLALTQAGFWAVVIVADIVALLAVLEFFGLRGLEHRQDA
jgi:hypothetical protein